MGMMMMKQRKSVITLCLLSQLKLLGSSPCLPDCSGSAGRTGATGRRRETQSKEIIGVKEGKVKSLSLG